MNINENNGLNTDNKDFETENNQNSFNEIISRFENLQKQVNEHQNTIHQYKSALNEILAGSQNLPAFNSKDFTQNQPVKQFDTIKNDNDAVLNEINEKFAAELAIPVIKEAFENCKILDMDSNASFRDQGIFEIMNWISKIYNHGISQGRAFKENEAAKSRMNSTIKNSSPLNSSGKVFTRKDLASMSPDEFKKNEDAIFEQVAKGLLN